MMSNYDARVISVLDYQSDLEPITAFHPSCKAAAKRRLVRTYPAYSAAIAQAFANRAATNVWGIVIEEEGEPKVVVKNLACAVRNPSYRRVLRVNMNASYPGCTAPIDTSFLTRNIHRISECAPAISRKSEQ